MHRRICSLLFSLVITLTGFAAPAIDLGIDTLRQTGFRSLEGKRGGRG